MSNEQAKSLDDDFEKLIKAIQTAKESQEKTLTQLDDFRVEDPKKVAQKALVQTSFFSKNNAANTVSLRKIDAFLICLEKKDGAGAIQWLKDNPNELCKGVFGRFLKQRLNQTPAERTGFGESKESPETGQIYVPENPFGCDDLENLVGYLEDYAGKWQQVAPTQQLS